MTTAQQVIDLAKSQVGYREGFSGGHWNNIEKYAAQVPGLEWANGYAWCDVFVCWCLYTAGLRGFPIAAYTGTSIAGWKAQGRWGDTPRVGAQVFFGNNEHTGLVGSFDAINIYTIEGNTNTSGSPEGDGVYAKTHRRTDPYVYGYGYPAYDGAQTGGPGGIVSGTVHISSAPTFPTTTTEPAAPTQEGDMHYFTVNGTGYAASATRTARIDDNAVATAVVKARAGAALSPAELDMFRGVQAALREPAFPIVVDQAGTEYAIGPKGPIVLHTSDQVTSIAALHDGATVTSSQTTTAAQALGQAV